MRKTPTIPVKLNAALYRLMKMWYQTVFLLLIFTFHIIFLLQEGKASKRGIKLCWLEIFGNWLTKVKNSSDGYDLYCKICNVCLKGTGGKSDLIKHQNTKKHKEKANCIANHKTIIDEFRKNTDEERCVQNLEVQLSAFIVEHNLAFACMDHLSLFLKQAIPDSKLTSKISCGRTKTTCLVKNVLGRTQFNFVCGILQQQKFSLCIDESTDITNKKSLCLIVRVALEYSVKDFFFGLIETENCDASSLFKCITDYFQQYNIPYKNNMIGFAADGAPNMTGKHHSVAKLFKNEISNLFIVKCICHSIALCSSYSCLKLPSEVESLVREVHSYVANSPKRNTQFQKVVKLLEYKPKKMLHPSQTRWLSLEAVVVRVLELYEPLKIFFALASNVDHIDSAEVIQTKLNDINELYLCFLKYILHIINNVNKVFQSATAQIQKMYDEMERLYLKILHNFVKPMYVNTNFKFEDFENKDIFLKNDVYLGIFVKNKISNTKFNTVELSEFIDNCIEFYIEFCKQITKRFDFNDAALKQLSYLDPLNIINKKVSSLAGLIKLFPNLIDDSEIQNLDDEYRELRLIDFNKYFSNLENVTVEYFWHTVSKITRADSELLFPTLSKFALDLISLPSSSANVERIFSKVNLNKTKYRNRLNNTTLEGILYTQDYLLVNKCSCYDLKIDSNILKNLKPKQYYN